MLGLRKKEVKTMNLIKWNPWREMELFDRPFKSLFDESFFPTSWGNDESGLGLWDPAVDIYDENDKMVIKAELPGMDKKDIDVDLNDHVLTLKGERNYENEENKGNYYHRERVFGKFQRSFRLPVDADPEKIKADFINGILTIEVPKPEEEKPKKITVH
jgi:HSP20 family protein